MSDCVYSDPKLKKVHYHLHYKKESAQALGNTLGNTLQQVSGTNIAQAGTQQIQIGQTQRTLNTGFISVDTTPIETIDINQKLLAERDSLRYRVIDLEQQLTTSLEAQKQEIIRVLEERYSVQLGEIEVTHVKQIEQERNTVIQLKQQLSELTAQNSTYKENTSSLQLTLEKYEAKFEKQAEKNKKEKDQIKKAFQEDIDKLHNEILDLKDRLRENFGSQDKPSKNFYEEQMNNLKAQMQWKEQRITKLESDNQNLEQQLHQYTLEISTLQTQIKIKSQDFDRYTTQRKASEAEKQLIEQRKQYEKTISNLEEKIDEQKLKIQKLKLQVTKGPIKTDPIIIERPVQVETVVESIKYIPVERVVKEYGKDAGNSVLLAQNDKRSEKEYELIKHYEDIIEKQSLNIDQLQRKIDTFSKIHNLQVSQQSAQDQQNAFANETIRKFQQENDYLKQSLQNYESNLTNMTKQFDGSN